MAKRRRLCKNCTAGGVIFFKMALFYRPKGAVRGGVARVLLGLAN